MVFATNSPMGIKVFKEAESHAARLQDDLKFEREFGNQRPLFTSDALDPVSEVLRKKYKTLACGQVRKLFSTRLEVPYDEAFCKALAMPLVTEGDLIDFLNSSPDFDIVLNGPRRRRPGIQKGDQVVKRN